MEEQPLSNRVRQLVVTDIPSVLQLEILLHLHSARPRFVPIDELVQPLAIEAGPLTTLLMDLQRRGMVAMQTTQPPAFAYSSTSAEKDEAVQELAEAYATYRVSVISLIHARPTDSIRAFADAFQIRKEGEPNG